ncbi:MAG: flagellar motor protein MotB [Desulfovibrionaceae bacterium]|nr:flagellar motor protein MotB [Desulfovibrionaceae bacterium]
MGGSWKVAYADFVTALMAFFLLMWIINMASDETKAVLAEFFTPEYWENVSAGGQGSRSGNISGRTGKTRDLEALTPADRTYLAVAQKLRETLSAQHIPPEARGVSTDKDGILLQVNADAMFHPNSAELLPEGEKVLDEVADILGEYNMFVVVRGHADYQEKGNDQYPGKWELSTARATACARYLVSSAGVRPSLIKAVGYGDIRPLVPGNTPEEAAKNRRVEFFFHRPEVSGTAVPY